jgi:isopenicillin N synthase-like dioxygenase
MSTTTVTADTYNLHIDSAYGSISRKIQKGPPRDARPGEVPIIDVSGMFSNELSERQAVAAQVRIACTGMRFFYIINYQIPDSVTEALENAARDFFHQPVEEKTKVYFDQQIEGYQGRNQEQINKNESIDIFEKLKITYRPSMDPISKLGGNPTTGYEEFPWERTASVPLLANAFKEFFSTRIMLARQLLRIIALALDLPEEYFDAKVARPQAAATLNYCPDRVQGEESFEPAGLGSHTDFTLITLLSQDDAGGLQILSPEGERISIPFFISLGPEVDIEVVETCDKPNRAKEKYEGITAGNWLRKRLMDVKLGKLAKGSES